MAKAKAKKRSPKRAGAGKARPNRPHAVKMGRRVRALEYEHADDGKLYRHDFARGVQMFALEDGTVLLRHREHPRKRVWADFPDQGR